MQFKYLYTDKKTGKKAIVTTYSQLSDKCGISPQTIAKYLKENNIFCDKNGMFEIEKVEYQKNQNKTRIKR